MRKKQWMVYESIIVLLIFALLLVVMIPKFLDSQLRAETVASMQNQMQIARAIQTLYQDREVMLIDLWDDDTDLGHELLQKEHHGVGDHTEHQRWMSDILAPLTTPLAYLDQLPKDPWGVNDDNRRQKFLWPGENFDNPGAESYLYIDNDPILDIDGRHQSWLYGRLVVNGEPATDEPGEFVLVGMGPIWQNGETNPRTFNPGTIQPTQVQYDPSNGLDSYGDMLYSNRVQNPHIPKRYQQKVMTFQRQIGGF